MSYEVLLSTYPSGRATASASASPNAFARSSKGSGATVGEAVVRSLVGRLDIQLGAANAMAAAASGRFGSFGSFGETTVSEAASPWTPHPASPEPSSRLPPQPRSPASEPSTPRSPVRAAAAAGAAIAAGQALLCNSVESTNETHRQLPTQSPLAPGFLSPSDLNVDVPPVKEVAKVETTNGTHRQLPTQSPLAPGILSPSDLNVDVPPVKEVAKALSPPAVASRSAESELQSAAARPTSVTGADGAGGGASSGSRETPRSAFYFASMERHLAPSIAADGRRSAEAAHASGAGGPQTLAGSASQPSLPAARGPAAAGLLPLRSRSVREGPASASEPCLGGSTGRVGSAAATAAAASNGGRGPRRAAPSPASKRLQLAGLLSDSPPLDTGGGDASEAQGVCWTAARARFDAAALAPPALSPCAPDRREETCWERLVLQLLRRGSGGRRGLLSRRSGGGGAGGAAGHTWAELRWAGVVRRLARGPDPQQSWVLPAKWVVRLEDGGPAHP